MGRNFGIYQILAIVILILILWFGFGSSSRKMVIGIIGPLTGPAALYGLSHRNGIKLAVDQINAAGGLLGKTIEAIFVDDINDKIIAAELCRNLIYQNRAVAIIGSILSDNTMNIQRICEKALIPVLTAVSTNPFITRVNFRYSFRCLSDDDIQAAKLANHTSNILKLRRVGILHDSNKYGSQGARTYKAIAESIGQIIVANEAFDSGTTNFQTQLQIIKGSNPDGLLIWGLARESALALRQAREIGMNIPAFGGDGMAPNAFIDLAGTSAEGVVLTFPFNPLNPSERAKQFLSDYRRAFGMEADSFSAHGFDAMTILAQAIKNSNGDGVSIRDALSKISVYEGVTGKGGFDQFGNETRPVELAVVKAGRFVPVNSGGLQ